MDLKKYDEALTWYDKVLEIDPKHVYALHNKGLALANLEKFEEAIVCYDRVLEIDPNHKNSIKSKQLAVDAAKLDK